MVLFYTHILATFSTPENIGTTPIFFLWILPLLAVISVVYKATKVSSIEAKSFIKETAILFGSIFVFMAVVAVVLHLALLLIVG